MSYTPPPIWEDPRPDLAEDHAAWDRLLRMAHDRNEDVCSVLAVLRAAGARLERGATGWMIRPGEWPRAEYEEFRKEYLTPRKDEISELLRELKKEEVLT